jgi:hypothetical protein
VSDVTICSYSTGSDTDCRPLCDAPATVGLTYGYGVYRVTSNVCQRHVRPTENRAWPEAVTIGAVASS